MLLRFLIIFVLISSSYAKAEDITNNASLANGYLIINTNQELSGIMSLAIKIDDIESITYSKEKSGGKESPFSILIKLNNKNTYVASDKLYRLTFGHITGSQELYSNIIKAISNPASPNQNPPS